MVDETASPEANSDAGPSEETKAEQRRTAKERQRRINSTKAALQADVVNAKLDATDRLLRAVVTSIGDGETEKVVEAVREHEEAGVAITTQAVYRGQADSLLDDADLAWEDEELSAARNKWEANDFAGALREVEKVAGPTQQSAEERVTQVQDEVRKVLVGMGLKVDDGGVGTGNVEKQPIPVSDLVHDPRAAKESVKGFLDDFFSKLEKRK